MTIYQSDLILIVKQNVAEKVNQFDLYYQLLNGKEEEEEEEEEEHVLPLEIPLDPFEFLRYHKIHRMGHRIALEHNSPNYTDSNL